MKIIHFKQLGNNDATIASMLGRALMLGDNIDVDPKSFRVHSHFDYPNGDVIADDSRSQVDVTDLIRLAPKPVKGFPFIVYATASDKLENAKKDAEYYIQLKFVDDNEQTHYYLFGILSISQSEDYTPLDGLIKYIFKPL